VVDVTDGADVDVGFGTIEFLFSHVVFLVLALYLPERFENWSR
jgi:hypothetical protein